ncbi:helix-turn-helix domain-containing protein [Gaetbulibacter sp. M235]|uniref:helix-turn-helix domain-containing protein n=1 Tax=Gaetbulibacter sp. M235 TaxID=3126510 RepID=UPI00374F6E30
MITKTIQINEITFDELADKVAEKLLIKIEVYLKELNEKGNDVFMTRNETIEFLKIDSSTLWHWTNRGVLNSYGISNRRYYNKMEIIDYLRSNRLR